MTTGRDTRQCIDKNCKTWTQNQSINKMKVLLSYMSYMPDTPIKCFWQITMEWESGRLLESSIHSNKNGQKRNCRILWGIAWTIKTIIHIYMAAIAIEWLRWINSDRWSSWVTCLKIRVMLRIILIITMVTEIWSMKIEAIYLWIIMYAF